MAAFAIQMPTARSAGQQNLYSDAHKAQGCRRLHQRLRNCSFGLRNQKRGHRCVFTSAALMDAPDDVMNMTSQDLVYPFSAIVGQDQMKLTLLLNAIDPRIGGVLITGDRGTGKSTVVRGLAEIMPSIEIVEGDVFNSSSTDTELMGPYVKEAIARGERLNLTKVSTPLVELPLGATEDRVVGTIDVERALRTGEKAFEPGLLARANRGILYVDEITLLDDFLVDCVLDSAASGWCTVEREGISIGHPARFVLIGSGNSEEGNLRPQLLDRFGMMVRVSTLRDVEQRVQLAKSAMLFQQDRRKFRQCCDKEQQELKDMIARSREAVGSVNVSRNLKLIIAYICSIIGVEGLRGDLVTTRAMCAYVAMNGRDDATVDDLKAVAPLCLRHRLKKDPTDPVGGPAANEKVRKAVQIAIEKFQ